MNHRKERSFLLGVKGELFFLSQKRKAPLKTSLFHLVFTDVNTPFVHVVNSPLFFEQQKRYEAGFACKRNFKPSWFCFEESFSLAVRRKSENCHTDLLKTNVFRFL